MAKDNADARVIARLDAEEQAILRRARMVTRKNTSAVIRAALRLYAQTLPTESPFEVFQRCGIVGAVSGPKDLSETYKDNIDYADKRGRDR